ncbi:serine/threonine-protein kinase [Actinomadura parmotrematis]|uniref:non-specific serine/threonine protein kinase n=1 Tax=Actinomadura parmotrematis TaxID=2864039 RepID=A0ABS7FSP9_9ACTN|nr:serine/threonine-protein kinase [Actinomadura parmotrematis]MBW8482985.1 serine/threonine protein kinase [Actinomadura parmotrematis]
MAGSGDVLGGRYRLGALLGRGGMGEVWSAEDLRLRRAVAVKVVTRELGGDPTALARFRREAEAAARLDHPGITAVHDFDEHGGRPYLVMQLLDGRELDALRGSSPGVLLGLMVQVAEALAHAHGQGVVHRDLKPGNLMCLPGGRAKICDFGLARDLAASTLTMSGTVLGTPAYMAPEQWRAEPATPRTDLYAFGATLHTLLAGAPPFSGTTVEQLRHQHLNVAPPRLSEVRPGLPRELDGILQRLLAKDPADRYGDALQVARELRRLPVTAARDERQDTQATQPGGTATRHLTGDGSTALAIVGSRWDVIKRNAQVSGKVAFWVGAAIGAVSSIGPGNEPPLTDQRTGPLAKLIMGGWELGLLLGAVVGLLGVLAGVLGRLDTFVLDADKLVITRRGQGDKALTLYWGAMERIAVDSYKWRLLVWFQPSRQPSAEWILHHGVEDDPSGCRVVFSGGASGRGSLRRLRAALPGYAGSLYEEGGFYNVHAFRPAPTDHVPDP